MSAEAKRFLEDFDPQIEEVGYDNYFYSPKEVIERLDYYLKSRVEAEIEKYKRVLEMAKRELNHYDLYRDNPDSIIMNEINQLLKQ